MILQLKKAYTINDEVVRNHRKLRSILLDLAPDKRVQINLLTLVVEMSIAEEIATYQNGKLQKHQKERWVKRLINEWAIDRQKALWAVECWCDVFEIDYPKGLKTDSKEEAEKDSKNQLILEDKEENKKREASSEDESNRFQRDDQKEIVIDKKTGLIWQDNKVQYFVKGFWGFEKKVDRLTWDQAFEYAKKLNEEKFAGYDDWRVPMIEELQTIVDYSRYDPAIKKEFKNVASHSYRSSTTYVRTISHAWGIYFYDGSSNGYSKRGIYDVRCVRSEKDIEPCHFQRDHQKEIVMDLSRNLIWQDNEAVADNKMTWQEAMEYAKKLNKEKFAGYDDWRVPMIEELQTIVDYSRYDPAIKKEFKNVASSRYWSSTDDGASGTFYVWGVHFYDGSSQGYNSGTAHVRCVRSGQKEVQLKRM